MLLLLPWLWSGCAPAGPHGEVPRPDGVPSLPDSGGWGVRVLAAARAPDGALWAGTYGGGILLLRPGAAAWERIAAAPDGISWNFVNAFAFPADGSVWYGTVGNGFGRSTDGGRSWTNWDFRTLGPEWQYVAPAGMAARGDTVYIATADGLRLTWDGGASWRCVQALGAPSGGAAGHDDRCGERLPSLPTKYLLSFDAGPDGTLWAGHLHGLSISRDGGRSWHAPEEAAGLPPDRVRAVAARVGGVLVATEDALYRGDVAVRRFEPVARATVAGLRVETAATLVGGRPLGAHGSLAGAPVPPPDAAAAAVPAEPLHAWLERPIRGSDGNPHIDQTYRYGSTMGGNFQQHQGVEFNNPAGVPVRAAGGGVVVFAGEAEAGARTVVILHDARWRERYLFTTYFHNTTLDVEAGARVRPGERIARVGNTGRATNDHLHFEVHLAPTPEVAAVVDPEVRFPPYTTNPQLWLRPLPGTGIVAGRVEDDDGRLVAGARIHGLRVDQPEETPFAFAESYGDRANASPAYDENFAVGDVPAGRYAVGVDIDGRRVWRWVTVEAGKLTWVELRPDGARR
jgi:murein DD-endopeptidase MepM/ murein hydrolase activator NlpD